MVNPGSGVWPVIASRFETMTDMETLTSASIESDAPNRNAVGQSASVAFIITHTIKAGGEKRYDERSALVGLFSNPWLWGAVLLSLLLQAADAGEHDFSER
jgi:hypothetical protein